MKPSTSGMGQHSHEGEKKCLNSELWHACAGPLVSLPTMGSRVVYFPQGHSEQVVATTNKEIDAHIPNYPSLPAQLICQLHNVTMHADVETDEVYAQMTLQPLTPQEQKDTYLPVELGTPSRQPTNYFCKTLTASDTSTHGGFSVPRRAAEKVFPPLDFSQTPPAQELIARDLHDVEWKFRHIFRDEVEPGHEEEEAMEIPNQEGGTFQTSSSGGASNTTISTTTGRAKRSKVWDHYEIEIKQGTNESFAVCKICKIRYSYKTGGGAGGTGTLRKHLVKIHKLDPENLQPLVREPTQQQINPFTAKAFTITKEISRKAIVKFVTKCCLPFLIAEQEGFVEFTSSIQPGFHNVSRHTLKKYCFDMYKEYKESLISHLSNITCRFSLTSDIWTNIKYESYLVVTCHWIDETWTMQKRILSLDKLESSHTGYTIARYISNVAKTYGIQNKIMAITLDNASANNAAIKCLNDVLKPILDGNLLHVRCACHVINLCVKCAFTERMASTIDKFKHCGKILRERRYGRDWKSLVISSGLKYKKFPLPVETRWNSLYHLLVTLLHFKDLLTPYYNNVCAPALMLTDQDWDILINCVSLLEIFKEATEKFSGVHYPTSTMFLPLLFNMFFKFIEFRTDTVMSAFVSSMEDKFLKYWETIPIVHGLATLLDPSQSQGGLDIFFEYYANFLDKNVDDQKKSIMHSLQDLFDLYANEQGGSSKQPEPEEVPKEKNKMGAINFFQSLKRQKLKGKSVTTISSNEIQIYLSQYFQTPENFDVLEWWKVNSQLYPILGSIARDVLPVQCSSVASESAFSTCGRIIGDQRTNLKPETLSMLTCLQDWFAAEKKNRTAGAIDEFATSSSEEDQEYSKYILVNRDEL